LNYALKPDGYLFLGSTENADAASELFRQIDREARLYVAKPVPEHAAPILPRLPQNVIGHFPNGAIRSGSILPPPLRTFTSQPLSVTHRRARWSTRTTGCGTCLPLRAASCAHQRGR